MQIEDDNQSNPEETHIPPRNKELRVRGIFGNEQNEEEDLSDHPRSKPSLVLRVSVILLATAATALATIKAINNSRDEQIVATEDPLANDVIVAPATPPVPSKPPPPPSLPPPAPPAPKAQEKEPVNQLLLASELLTAVNWEAGLHHDLASITLILETAKGERYSGIVLDDRHLLTSSEIRESIDLRAIKSGKPYKLVSKAIDPDTAKTMKITRSSNLGISLVEFDSPVFGKELTARHSNEKVNTGDYLIVCGNPKNSPPRTLNGGEVQEILDSNIILLGVEADAGYLGAPVTNLKGEIIGIVMGKTEKPFTYEFRNPKKPGKEISSTVLSVMPLPSLQAAELSKFLEKN